MPLAAPDLLNRRVFLPTYSTSGGRQQSQSADNNTAEPIVAIRKMNGRRANTSGGYGAVFVGATKFSITSGIGSRDQSERSACMTSTRAARAAGSIEATTAAPNNTSADTTTGKAP